MSEIEQRVKRIVADHLKIAEDQIGIDSSFVDDLGADSLHTVEIVLAIEDEFDIKPAVSDLETKRITSVRQAIDLVTAHTKM